MLNRPKQKAHDKWQRVTHPCTAVVMPIINMWVDELIHDNSRVREDLIILHSIHQERQYSENYWKAWPLCGQRSLSIRCQNAQKEARKANTTDC
jgi:hypothetical protein